MGAEHSSQTRNDAEGREVFEHDRTSSANSSTKRRAAAQRQGSTSSKNSQQQGSPTFSDIGRPVSPPLSVCYDSDLPYVSYTDRPIGDSPKIRNKNTSSASGLRSVHANSRYKQTGTKPKRPASTSNHNIVIVKPGTTRDLDLDLDPDLARLRSIPMFLPVMRETLSLPSSREPEILERLQSVHLQNICHRMQAHLNYCATHVATEQSQIIEKTKMVNNQVTTLFATFVDMQKTYAAYAEQFSKIRSISQQLSRCNSLLNENIESLEAINNFLDVDDRLEPFVWKTEEITHKKGGSVT
ncbi:BLOC-1-related complex subunit 5 [Episyrphus balteatus]|uniref:BLOC-1-related complex subunit 5 n=1 Tax=Episyrphus balteatus TaxID=286459 RepID=UPI002484F223|nr:BLOC-1-related complex subunit 5 [Episyrphus balteatus]